MLPPRRPPRVVVTPGGRKRYLHLLARHLEAQRGSFDTWQIWLNTKNEEDLAYMRGLASAHPDWIVARELPIEHQDNMSIHAFFPGAAERGTTYLRLDDDVVWLESGFIEAMMSFRETYPAPFLVYGSIVNNAVVSHLFHRFGCVNSAYGHPDYTCMCDIGWNNGSFAELLHRSFLDAVEAGSDLAGWRFPAWTLYHYERVSINCIAWLGDDFAQFGGIVGSDEEQWLSVEKPQELGRPNVIAGGVGHMCAHFAFYPQRAVMDASGLLERYAALVP